MEKFLKISDVVFYGKSNWTHPEDEHNKILSEMYKRLVPNVGMGETMHGELIRCMNNISYDYFNNGFGNIYLIETKECEDCWGWDDECDTCYGEVIEERRFNEYFLNQFKYLSVGLKKHYGSDAEQYLNSLLKSFSFYDNGLSDEEVEKSITDIADLVLHLVLNTENVERETIKILTYSLH